MKTTNLTLPNDGAKIFVGDSFELRVSITTSTGEPIDLRDFTKSFTVSEYSGSKPYFELTETDIEVMGDDNNILQINILPEHTKELPVIEVNTFFFRVRVTDTDGETGVPVTGHMIVHGEYHD